METLGSEYCPSNQDWRRHRDDVEARDPDALVFEAGELLERVEEHGDLFEPVLKLEQKLPKL